MSSPEITQTIAPEIAPGRSDCFLPSLSAEESITCKGQKAPEIAPDYRDENDYPDRCLTPAPPEVGGLGISRRRQHFDQNDSQPSTASFSRGYISIPRANAEQAQPVSKPTLAAQPNPDSPPAPQILQPSPSVNRVLEAAERAALIEEIKARPKCQDCAAYLDIGKSGKPERCLCHRYDSKKNRPRQDRSDGRPYEKGLQAAHYYQLNKTIKSGSWAKTGYRRPQRTRKSSSRLPWYGQDNKAIAVFLTRCDIAVQRWRDEFAGLMKDRVALRLRGMEEKDVSSWLDLSRREIAELDSHIRQFIPLPRYFYDGPIPALERKTKRGVASDVLRRRRLGIYKQGQVLLPQRVNPLLR